jgi:dethiobiotin synthetase
MTDRAGTYFITGTDTDVGKTVTAVWLASALAPSARIALVKPVQTGTLEASTDGDEAFYRRHLNDRVTIETIESLPEPLAPSIAAERANTRVDLAPIVERCCRIAQDHDVTLVEGAGGLLVTINEQDDMTTLAGQLEAPLVVVIRPTLGTLNHTMLTVEAAERRGLAIELLICSGFPDYPGVVEVENLRFLRTRLPSLPIVVLRHADLAKDGLEALRPALLGEAPPLLDGVKLPQLKLECLG